MKKRRKVRSRLFATAELTAKDLSRLIKNINSSKLRFTAKVTAKYFQRYWGTDNRNGVSWRVTISVDRAIAGNDLRLSFKHGLFHSCGWDKKFLVHK